MKDISKCTVYTTNTPESIRQRMQLFCDVEKAEVAK